MSKKIWDKTITDLEKNLPKNAKNQSDIDPLFQAENLIKKFSNGRYLEVPMDTTTMWAMQDLYATWYPLVDEHRSIILATLSWQIAKRWLISYSIFKKSIPDSPKIQKAQTYLLEALKKCKEYLEFEQPVPKSTDLDALNSYLDELSKEIDAGLENALKLLAKV